MNKEQSRKRCEQQLQMADPRSFVSNWKKIVSTHNNLAPQEMSAEWQKRLILQHTHVEGVLRQHQKKKEREKKRTRADNSCILNQASRL